jgi:chemotaxis protein MotB
MNYEFKKKKKPGKEPSATGWESVYCSLVLILVALFALLVCYSTIEGEKLTNFTRGFGGSSKKYSRSLPYNSVREDIVYTGGDKFEEGNNVLYSRLGITEADEASIASDIQSLKKYFTKMGLLDKSIDIDKIQRGFKIDFVSNVLFASGMATVIREAYPYLDQIIIIALKNPFFIRIEGHTDDVPINTPEFPSNWELSTARAVNVLRYFLEKKIPAERLAAVGFSEYHPVASNDTPEGRQKNRRVELYFELQKNRN